MGGPTENVNFTPKPTPLKNGTQITKFNSFKESHFKNHISHSTGDLNTRVNLSLFESNLTVNDSQFFEVMYIGKIKVSHKKVPKTFIDDALPKFKAHDAMKLKNLMLAKTRQSISDTSNIQEDLKAKPEESNQNEEKTEDLADIPKRNRSASMGAVIEQNRTMVFLLGRSDIRLISPDRKQVLLHKNFKDLLNCVQGVENSDHFGIICTESARKGEFIGYVFKCQSDCVAADIVASLNKSITILLQKSSPTLERVPEYNEFECEDGNNNSLTCDHCPTVWYKRLIQSTELLSDKKKFSTIVRFIETLSSEDQDKVMEKFYSNENVSNFSTKERNEFLLEVLEAFCEKKQKRHVHDTIENRSEFLNQYLGGSTIFTKAKRTFTSSLDIFKRRGSRDSSDANNNPAKDESQKYKITRSMSLSPSISQTQSFKYGEEPQQLNSQKMDIFLKVGNTHKDEKTVNSNSNGSWRQEIMKNVVSPGETSDLLQNKQNKNFKVKRSKEELRQLWKFAGRQVILLKRMETENTRLKRRQNDHEIRKIKLKYDEILPCDSHQIEVWEALLKEASKSTNHDNKLFLQAIKNGVPNLKRGEVWLMLAEQFNKNHPPLNVEKFPFFTTPYQDLLKNLTEHQHAIFLDIGRTFPNHQFFHAPFGLGQLSLFNMLKAYSILDPEVGYCQGLAFLCGILLLHLSEKDAFYLLKHLMFKRHMRLKYLPDMKEFKLELYQISRLMKDYLPDLYNHLEKNEISPTLYASPWILTIFSSAFPLGFVSRVFDLLFFASDEVIFRVILALLDVHSEELLKCEGFEEITGYMKHTIPQITSEIMGTIFKKVYTLSITRQLVDYKIEYDVLKEEITQNNKHLENLKKTQDEKKKVEKQLNESQCHVEELKTQVKGLESTIQTLGSFLSNLSIRKPDIEIPSDIKKVLQQLEYQQRQAKRHIFGDRKTPKSLSLNGNVELNVLHEQNENEITEMPTITPLNPLPTQIIRNSYFQNTHELIKKQNSMFKTDEKIQETSESFNVTGKLQETKDEQGKQTVISELTDIPRKSSDTSLTDQIQIPLICGDMNFLIQEKELRSVRSCRKQ